MSEDELRELWRKEYCDPSMPLFTFDDIEVKFYPDMFDHAFYESFDRKNRDKSVLSHNRLEKIFWIRDTLQDETAIFKEGWLRDERRYDKMRRIALVKGNYVVIIQFSGHKKARFITAYEILENEDNILKIHESPDWKA